MPVPPPIVDAHSDLLLELAEAPEPDALSRRWLGPLRAGGVVLQVCAIYVDEHVTPERALREALRQVRTLHAAVAEARDDVVWVRRAEDLERCEPPRVGLMLALEGARCLEPDPWLLDVFVALGLRMASLTWNEENAFAGGSGSDAGLTELGRELVRRIAASAVVLDLAHASRATFFDALEALDGGGPVVVSHAACHALYAHPRNLDDPQLRALAEQDGVLGIMPHPLVLDADPSRADLGRVADHVDHAVEVAGIRHVGLGGDFLRQIARALSWGERVSGLPMDAAVEGLAGPEEYPALVEVLSRRGYSDEDLHAVLGGNLRRVLARGLAAY